VRAASGEVALGRTASLEAPIENQASADNPDPARHRMIQAPSATDAGLAFAADRISMNVHGNADSHLDALCHVSFDGALYNGVSADAVTGERATEPSIAIAAGGIVGRGVLLDVPRSRGVDWLEPGDHVTVDDLLAAERDQKVRIGQGDIVFVRVGHRLRRKERGAWDAAAARAGLHPGVLPLLAQRQVAVLGSDGNNDTAPSVADGVDFPVHAGHQCARHDAAGLPRVRGARAAVRGGGAMVVPVRHRAAPAADGDWVAGESHRCVVRPWLGRRPAPARPVDQHPIASLTGDTCAVCGVGRRRRITRPGLAVRRPAPGLVRRPAGLRFTSIR
jgi:kynurenine formamidase